METGEKLEEIIMKNAQFQEHALKAMIAVNTAIQNLRLYPANSPSTVKAVEDACQSIMEAFNHGDRLVFSESDGNLLICEEVVSENGQKRLMVEAFIELMIHIGIQHITFSKDIEEVEIKDFLKAVTAKPEVVAREGGLKRIIAAKNLRHILIDYKTDETANEKQSASSEEQSASLQEQNGSSKEVKKINITKTFSPMVHILDHILDDNRKDPVSRHLAASMAHMDIPVLNMVLTQKVEGEFGEKLFGHILDELEDQTLEKIITRMKQMMDAAASDIDQSDSLETNSIRQAYQKVIKTEKGERIENEIKKRQVEERAKKEKQLAELKAGIERIVKGEAETFKDEQLMQSLPATILQMFAKKNEKSAWAIIDGLKTGLASKEKEVRSKVSEALLTIVDGLSSGKRLETLDKLAASLKEWIKLENSSSQGYKKTCDYMGALARAYIQKRQFIAYQSIWETFKAIQNKKIQKDEEIRLLASATLDSITTEEIITALAEELQSVDKEKSDQAARILILFGGDSVDALLDLLEQSHERSIRAKIVQVLSDIGRAAMPAVTEKIDESRPWYYLRNLAMLLGKIGNQDSLNHLRPLLLNKEYRVQREALNSIYAIGGEKRTEILLSVLWTADDRLKVDIVGMLGALKWDMAESVFLEMIESKTLAISKTRNDLVEKICNVLGSIGTKKAVPTLRSIVEQKRSLMGKKSYAEKVRIAAEKALAKIEGKDAADSV